MIRTAVKNRTVSSALAHRYQSLPADTRPCSWREGVRDVWFAVQPGHVIHRITRQDLVSHRQAQGKPEDDPGLFGAVAGLLGQLLEEVIEAGHAQLS